MLSFESRRLSKCNKICGLFTRKVQSFEFLFLFALNTPEGLPFVKVFFDRCYCIEYEPCRKDISY